MGSGWGDPECKLQQLLNDGSEERWSFCCCTFNVGMAAGKGRR